jgi:hypothetical protein
MRKLVSASLLLLAFAVTSFSQESYEKLVRRFDYDKSAPLDVRQHGVEEREGVKI